MGQVDSLGAYLGSPISDSTICFDKLSGIEWGQILKEGIEKWLLPIIILKIRTAICLLYHFSLYLF